MTNPVCGAKRTCDLQESCALQSLTPEVARVYGHEEAAPTLERQIEAATAAKDWGRVAALSARLIEGRGATAG